MKCRLVSLLTITVLATGCVSKEAMKKSSEYGNHYEVVKTQYGVFWVYEHPSKKKLAVSTSIGSTIGQGVVKGLTFGAANTLPSEGAFQEAAEAYLAGHKEIGSCKIANGYLLQDPIFEFILSCG